ncbi:hypothetical protein BD289DRAFT_484165 [Coniella lustricola]|uniref:WSC domain-containing protein n=1 Tax=Coniella lustricola TaxID=2025994 RepID=A0A2T3A2U8_9PEZI|nr:hypothetical protein BD289DRAFT_484165 [Coniella lustricola]
MSSPLRLSAWLGSLVALYSICPRLTAATPSIAIAYCASINTGSTAANTSIYQSEGLCYDECNDGGYALAVLQDQDCWCSNYVPASSERVSTDECDTACPGYPSDYCGGDNLYGYLALSAAVSGTKGATTSTSSTTSSTTSSSTFTTTQLSTSSTLTEPTQTTASSSTSVDHTTTSTLLTSSIQSSETTTTTSPKTTTTSTDPKTTSSSDSSPNVVTSIQTVTSDGTIVYETVTTVAKASSSGTSALSKGAIAGLIVGILAVLVAFVVGALLFRRQRKLRQQAEQAPLAAGMAGSHRRMSSAGMMSKAGTVSSHGYGLAMEEDSYGSPSRRMSMKPMDPRLDPKQTFGLYRAASHDSLNTIRDDQDYSRRVHEPTRALRVFNPDPVDD